MGANSSKQLDDINLDDVNADDTIIAVVGQSGVGKSTFINTAAGEAILEVGHGLTSISVAVRHVVRPSAGRCRAARVVFVDVPAFDSDKEEKIAEMKLKQWLKALSLKKLKISGILYLYRITDFKLSDPPLGRLSKLENLYNESKQDFPKRVALVTTMWGQMKSKQVGADREEELRKHWNGLARGSAGSPLMRFEDSCESAWSIVSALMG